MAGGLELATVVFAIALVCVSLVALALGMVAHELAHVGLEGYSTYIGWEVPPDANRAFVYLASLAATIYGVGGW